MLIANAKKSLPIYQLARDLDLNQKTAWYLITRIRTEMAKKGSVILKGIIEAGEVYIAGKPQKKTNEKMMRQLKEGAAHRKRRSLVPSKEADLNAKE